MSKRRPAPPEPPASMPAAEQARWREVVGEVASRGPVDLEQLTAYCRIWVRWKKAEDGIAQFGAMVKRGKSGAVGASPLLAVSKDTGAQARALEQVLGIGQGDAAGPSLKGGITWRMVNRPQLAELLGVHPDRVTHYTRQGMPVVTAGGRGRESAYDAVECLAWWRAKQEDGGKDAAQVRALKASAEANELKNAQTKGELVSRAQARLEGQAYTKAWSKKVRGFPRRLVQLGIVARDKEAAAAAVCQDLLLDIATWKTVADLEKAASDE